MANWEDFRDFVENETQTAIAKDTLITEIGDSLDLVNLASVIEDKLGLKISDKDLFNFKTVGDVFNLVCAELNDYSEST